VVGPDKVRITHYDPRRPHHERYLSEEPKSNRRLLKRVRADALKLCRALGYDFNTVEFAVQDGIPYAIDFLNPVPDAELNSIGADTFEWLVESVADLAIRKAKAGPQSPALNAEGFLKGAAARSLRKVRARKKAVPSKTSERLKTVTASAASSRKRERLAGAGLLPREAAQQGLQDDVKRRDKEEV
jgi:hypothetical protein